MSIIEKLKLSQQQPPRDMSPEQRLRIKLSEALDRQITAAVYDASSDTPYERFETQEVQNSETGEFETRKVKKRFSRWWWSDESGKMFLSLRYANKSLEIKPKKTAVEINDGKHLIEVLKALQSAVLVGELDTQLKQAADARRAQFKKRKPSSATATK